MSIFMGALGGAGEALGNIGSTLMKDELAREGRVQESNLALERAKALELFKMEVGNRERTAQVQRVDAAAGRIADAKVGEKRAEIERGIVDRAGWTPEQQAAVDQSLAADRQATMGDMKTRTQAAIQTGDIAPKDAAQIDRDDRRIDATEKATEQRERASVRREETREYIALLREETAQRRIELLMKQIAAKGSGGGKDGTKEALSFLDGARKELASDAQNLRQLYQSQIKDKSRGEVARIEAEFQPKFADIERKRAQIEEDYNAVRERVGLPARTKTETPAPSPAPKPGAAPASNKPAGRPPLDSFLK